MKRCSCGLMIIWMKTEYGNKIPVDYKESISTEKIFNPKTMKSHFSTCTMADKFRKPKEKK